MKKQFYFIFGVVALVIIGLVVVRYMRAPEKTESITVAMAPYQDMAMVVNIKNLELEKKYGVEVDLKTMAWENILPAIGSSGETADLGFASLIEYLNKEKNLNSAGADPILFIYPAYVFKGGAFVTFKPDVPTLTADALKDRQTVRNFLDRSIGAQKNSVYEMMVFSLARRADTDIGSVRLIDISLDDGIRAAQSGSLDIAEAGLTQLTEAQKQGGRSVLTMEDLGFADITGFVCKKSTLDKKRPEIEKFIKMWFESVNFVMSDLENNSGFSRDYLDKNSATKYTLEQYKQALSQEYFPRSVEEATTEIVSDNGRYSYRRIAEDVAQYMLQVKKADLPTIPSLISLPRN